MVRRAVNAVARLCAFELGLAIVLLLIGLAPLPAAAQPSSGKPIIIAALPSSELKSLRDVIAGAKADPQKLNYASPGTAAPVPPRLLSTMSAAQAGGIA